MSAEAGFGWARALWQGLAPFLLPHRREFAVIVYAALWAKQRDAVPVTPAGSPAALG